MNIIDTVNKEFVNSLYRLAEDRVGDICNACVLLVKRWKKLPLGSKKNWNHVSHHHFYIYEVYLKELFLI